MPAPAKNGLTRLYHSNVNLPRSITQYEITKNLGKSLEHLPKCDTTLEGKKKSLAGEDCGERLSLLLPEIEPNCELVLDVNARDASATVISTPDRGVSRNNDGTSDDIGDKFDYITNFDDDNETAKTKLQYLGQYEMEHNWILHENLQKNLDNFEKKSKKLQIPEPGYEARAPITDRLTEVKRMLKPSAELGNYFNNLDPSQKEIIAKLSNMDAETFQTEYRPQGPSDTKGKVQEAYRKIVMMINACHPRRKYYREDKPNTAATLKRMKKSIDKEEKTDHTRASVGFDMQLALTTSPEYRTEKDIKKVAWVLRATKAFKNLFPAEAETELARILAYERYDGNRIISYQEREPERFYYILTGKVQKIKEYRLSSGTVSRNEGYIEKGTTTDVDELERNVPRDHHLVSRGQVEVLIIQRDDFLRLRNKTQGPPIEFLRTLELFMEFPVEVFIDTTDVIDLAYYGQNVLICDDSNRTPWLYIVKSGKVKVVRSQNVVNTEQDNQMFKGATEDIGCVRNTSHANAMFGNLISQRRMKALRSNTFTLPEITKRHRPSISQISKKPVSADPALLKRKSKRTKKPKSVKVSEERTTPDTEEKKPPTIDENVSIHIEEKKENLFPPIIVEPPGNTNTTKLDLKDNTFKPHGTYLTREKTDFDSVYCNKQKKDSQLRKTYLQLDVLRRGDIFGLDSVSRKFQGLPDYVEEEGLEHLHPTLASEPKGVSLVSDGAEVIRISKRFFLLHAKNNTMLRVETMHREYMSPDEARTSLYTSETWNQYKSELMKRMVSALSSRT